MVCRRRAPPAALILAALAGCGYEFGSLQRFPTLALDMFDNKTERRGQEFEFSRVLAREMARRGIQIDPDADHALRGEIVSMSQSIMAADRTDQPLGFSFAVKVRFRVVRVTDNKEVLKGEASQTAVYSPPRGQSLDSALEELSDGLSKNIVSKLERGW